MLRKPVRSRSFIARCIADLFIPVLSASSRSLGSFSPGRSSPEYFHLYALKKHSFAEGTLIFSNAIYRYRLCRLVID